jgi:hypothetical protein
MRKREEHDAIFFELAQHVNDAVLCRISYTGGVELIELFYARENDKTVFHAVLFRFYVLGYFGSLRCLVADFIRVDQKKSNGAFPRLRRSIDTYSKSRTWSICSYIVLFAAAVISVQLWAYFVLL